MKKLFLLPFMFFACQNAPNDTAVNNKNEVVDDVSVSPRHPEWTKSANIYEVNIRQYSEEGTINEFAKHLPRLKELGVDILWIMPIQPIGLLNRKENENDLGSFYSIKDYTSVNPDLGTIDDFKELVDLAHEQDMKVILDWVANHTSWDNEWVANHPDWYTADSLGNRPIVPIDNEGNPTDWTDVADLDYTNSDMRSEMLESMKFWLNTSNIDGFRCDVAGFIPYDFWQNTIEELKIVKSDLFMLAEWEDPNLTQHFNMDYGWHLHHLMNQIAKGEEKPSILKDYLVEMNGKYQPDDMRMFFTTNHDENSWNGTVYERMGNEHLPMFILASTFEQGMPLIYSGQEAGLDHRLSFFGKDEIDWSNLELSEFYKTCLSLKHENRALWNAGFGGELTFIETNNETVIAYKRVKEGNQVVVLLNFSDTSQNAQLMEFNSEELIFNNWFTTGETHNLSEIELDPFGYQVFINNQEI